jgi:hypothetical protein
MQEPRIETITKKELAWDSEDGSRRFGRNHRLLPMAVIGFVLLALCMMLQDIHRLVGGG